MILAAEALSSRRIRVALSGSNVWATTVAGSYVMARTDGGPVVVGVAKAWLSDVQTVELALNASMLDGVGYSVTVPDSSSAVFVFSRPLAPPTDQASPEDPEAEMLGVDIDWLSSSLDGTGDCPQIRGRDCVVNDMTAVALTHPGEIFHQPTVGAGLYGRVNSPNLPGELDELRADLVRQWKADDRVKNAQCQTVSTTSGEVYAIGKIITVPLPDVPLNVKVR